MIIYLYGPDSYRRGQKLREIIAEYEQKHSGLTLSYFDGEDEGLVVKLRDFTSHQSLFGGNRLGVLRSPECAGSEAADNARSLLGAKGTTLVIVSDEKIGAPWDFLEEATAQEFPALSPEQFHAFLAREAGRRGVRLDPVAARSLVEQYRDDTWGAMNELEKIALGGDAERAVRAPEFFPSVLALSRGPLRTRLSSLAELLEREEPAAVFNVLASFAGGREKATFADYDAVIKSGKLEYEEALLDWVLATSD